MMEGVGEKRDEVILHSDLQCRATVLPSCWQGREGEILRGSAIWDSVSACQPDRRGEFSWSGGCPIWILSLETVVQAYCRSTCSDYLPPSTNAGKLMRHWFSVIKWGNMTEMDVRCTDKHLNDEGHLPFLDMYAKMRSATFCPAFPGVSRLATSPLLVRILQQQE